MALRRNNGSVKVDNIISNTSVNVIQITEDKLENILMRHLKKLEKPRDLIGAISLFLSLLIVMFTTEFKNIMFLNSDTWKGIFICLLIGSAVYLGYVIKNIYKDKDSIESIMEDIKNSN